MFSGKPGVYKIILLLFTYLPVLLGSGECLSLSLRGDGTVSMDYRHHCGKESRGAAADQHAGQASHPGAPERNSDTEIPLASGSAVHSMPDGRPESPECALKPADEIQIFDCPCHFASGSGSNSFSPSMQERSTPLLPRFLSSILII